MIGILLMSHGEMALGTLESCKLFFGDDLPQVKALCLMSEDDPELFDQRIADAIAEIDDGHGVIGFCDLMGGTPCNRCAISAINDRFQVITGMNFPMVLEFLGKRLAVEDIAEVDIEELMNVGRNGIVNINTFFAE